MHASRSKAPIIISSHAHVEAGRQPQINTRPDRVMLSILPQINEPYISDNLLASYSQASN